MTEEQAARPVEPRTEAGKGMLDSLARAADDADDIDWFSEAILAIEAEAARPVEGGLREALDKIAARTDDEEVMYWVGKARTAMHRAALAAAPRGASEPPEGTKLVLMGDDLFTVLGADRVEWGEPDEHGWYTPTLFRDEETPWATDDDGDHSAFTHGDDAP
jgi:hypothetical protein